MEDSIEEQIKQLIREECSRNTVKSQQHNGVLMMDITYHGDAYNN